MQLEPPQGRTSRGRALLAYVLEPFLRGNSPISNAHTHDWESLQIAQTLLERGFSVDVISYLNRTFNPADDYRIFIGARTNFERIAPRVPAECIKIVHLDTAHWLFNNQAAYRRLLDLQKRRGVTLDNIKTVEANWAIEHADMGTVLGNDFTIDTYRYAGKPLFRIPISTPETYDWAADKDIEAARHRYLWFGSSGFVHKGLDLVLEAFAGMPDKRLVVCGPFDDEPRFLDAYRKELFETSNIEATGWVDVSGQKFRNIAQSCIGLIYPSCSEGGGGSAITCMHAGMVPLLSRETSVDVGDSGLILTSSDIGEIRARVRALSEEPEERLAARVQASIGIARESHTREIFAAAFARFVDDHLLQRPRNPSTSSLGESP
ncbi:MAG TPA: glycosyltransferase [Gammaproteobacteria bacterium]|nr:glycosyltransferase [Gammaproteobacteria bacterium]